MNAQHENVFLEDMRPPTTNLDGGEGTLSLSPVVRTLALA
jgi:hypothetical protein